MKEDRASRAVAIFGYLSAAALSFYLSVEHDLGTDYSGTAEQLAAARGLAYSEGGLLLVFLSLLHVLAFSVMLALLPRQPLWRLCSIEAACAIAAVGAMRTGPVAGFGAPIALPVLVYGAMILTANRKSAATTRDT